MYRKIVGILVCMSFIGTSIIQGVGMNIRKNQNDVITFSVNRLISNDNIYIDSSEEINDSSDETFLLNSLIDETWLGYCDGSNELNFGSSGPFDIAIELRDDELAGYRGWIIDQIRVYIAQVSQSYTIWIQQSKPIPPNYENIVATGTTYTAGWQLVDVEEYVIPDAGNVCIGVNYLTDDESIHIAGFDLDNIDGYGDWIWIIKYPLRWRHVVELFIPFVEGVWSLQAKARLPNDPPYTPSNPNPANHATDVDINADLSWTGGDPDTDDTVTYDVYFGENSNPPLVSEDQSDTFYDPGTMNSLTTYFWKIVSKDNHGATSSGPTWDFTTYNNPPNTPSNPNPSNHATGIDINPTLSWTGGDPDTDDIVTYDIYFGTSSNPPLKKENHGTTYYNPFTLEPNEKYYWKIVAKDNHEATSTGPTWDFTTCDQPNDSPYTPSNPNPANHATDVNIFSDLSWKGGDPDTDDTVTYDVYFGENSNPPLVSEDQSDTFYYPGTMNSFTTYFWKIVSKDNHAATTTGPIWDFTTGTGFNNPPIRPSTPVGPTYGLTGTIYTFSTSTTDPENDEIKYGWDWWGDGTFTEWSGLMPSGSTYDKVHAWDKPGTYNIKVRAKDIHGAESGWSPALTIIISEGNKPPTVSILSIEPLVVGISNPTGLVSKGPDPVTFIGEGDDPDGKNSNLEYIWYSSLQGEIGKEKTLVKDDLQVGEHTIMLYVRDEDGDVSESIVYSEKVRVVNGLVFRKPYTDSNFGLPVNPTYTDPIGDGEDYPHAFRNTKRGDLYVYSVADFAGKHIGITGTAEATHFVDFRVNSDTRYISVETKVHTCGGKLNAGFGKSGVDLCVGYFSFGSANWYGISCVDKLKIVPVVSGYEILFAYLPAIIGQIFGRVISSTLDLFIAMSTASLDILSYNTMLYEMKNEDTYKENIFTVADKKIDIPNSGWDQVVTVYLSAFSTSTLFGHSEASEIGLVEYIIIKKDTSGSKSCFPVGTKITMADGSTKNIEDVKIGDKILSYNFKKQEYTSWKVKVIEKPFSDLYSLNNGLINFSAGHPFYIMKQDGSIGWANLEPIQNAYRINNDILKLEVGDKLYKEDGNWINITDITYEEKTVEMYNLLSYYGHNNYYANGILVHEDYTTLSYLLKNALDDNHPLIYLFEFLQERNLTTKLPFVNLLFSKLIRSV